MTDSTPDKQTNFQGSVTGSAVDGGSVNAENIAGRDVNITHNYALPPAEKPNFPLHDIPYPQNPHFTGREEILKQVANTLSASQTAVVTQTIAGLGGVGKTQVVLAYCYANLHTYDLIYWLNADSEPGLSKNVMAFSRHLNLVAQNVTDQQAALQAVLQFLSQTSQHWLLVYDNADQIQPAQLTPYLPRTGNGHILITSRNPNWRSFGQVLELDVFTLDEATVFLLQRRGIEAQGDGTQWQEATELAEALGRFPLALEHAAAYVEAKSSDYGTYHRLFTNHQTELWKRADKPQRYHATIFTTWALALDEMKKTPGALDLLLLCSFLDPENIQIGLVKQLASMGKSRISSLELLEYDLEFDVAVSTLRRYSFIQRDHDVLAIHQLVQLAVRQGLVLEHKELYGILIFDLILALIKASTRETSFQLFLHLWALIKNNEELNEHFTPRLQEDKEFIRVFNDHTAFWRLNIDKVKEFRSLIKNQSAKIKKAQYGFQGATKISTSAGKRALPRLRTLWTNSKNPR